MHISQGIIIGLLFLPYLGYLEFYIVVFFPFLIDFDFLLSKYAKNNNHRRLITHSLTPYVCLLIIGIFYPLFLILGICGVVHVISDAIDWGTSLLAPFYNDPLGGILKKPPKEIVNITNYRKRQCWFVKTYYTSRIILLLEILFGIASVISIILTNLWYLALLIFYFLFLVLQLNFYKGCQKKFKEMKEK